MQRGADEAFLLNMAFFRSVTLSDLTPAISGDGVLLRPAQMSDCSAWIRLRERQQCFRAFLDNHWLGFAVFAGIALDFGVRLHRWPNAW